MNTVLAVPPEAVRGMAAVMDRQGGALDALRSYRTVNCGNVAGLDGASAVIRSAVTATAQVHAEVLGTLS